MNLLTGALFLSIWHSILFWKQEIGISAILFAIPTCPYMVTMFPITAPDATPVCETIFVFSHI